MKSCENAGLFLRRFGAFHCNKDIQLVYLFGVSLSMKSAHRLATISLLTLAVLKAAGAQSAPQYPAYPSETPGKFEAKTETFDYTRREVMIPMRDGVKLHTVILVPKGAKDAPILLTRTPYMRANSPPITRAAAKVPAPPTVLTSGRI